MWRYYRPRRAYVVAKPPKKRTGGGEPLQQPAWDDTVHDLSKLKLSPEQQLHKKLNRISKYQLPIVISSSAHSRGANRKSQVTASVRYSPEQDGGSSYEDDGGVSAGLGNSSGDQWGDGRRCSSSTSCSSKENSDGGSSRSGWRGPDDSLQRRRAGALKDANHSHPGSSKDAYWKGMQEGVAQAAIPHAYEEQRRHHQRRHLREQQVQQQQHKQSQRGRDRAHAAGLGFGELGRFEWDDSEVATVDVLREQVQQLQALLSGEQEKVATLQGALNTLQRQQSRTKQQLASLEEKHTSYVSHTTTVLTRLQAQMQQLMLQPWTDSALPTVKAAALPTPAADHTGSGAHQRLVDRLAPPMPSGAAAVGARSSGVVEHGCQYSSQQQQQQHPVRHSLQEPWQLVSSLTTAPAAEDGDGVALPSYAEMRRRAGAASAAAPQSWATTMAHEEKESLFAGGAEGAGCPDPRSSHGGGAAGGSWGQAAAADALADSHRAASANASRVPVVFSVCEAVAPRAHGMSSPCEQCEGYPPQMPSGRPLHASRGEDSLSFLRCVGGGGAPVAWGSGW